MKALKGTFADRPIVATTPNVPPIPTGDPVTLRAVSDEIAARRPDVVRSQPVVAVFDVRSRITATVERATSVNGSLDDVRALLRLLGTAKAQELAEHDRDGVAWDALARLQTLCHVAGVALHRFDEHTRSAPPAALKDLVVESLTTCAAAPDNGCDVQVAPWDGPATCGDEQCERAYLRAIGELS